MPQATSTRVPLLIAMHGAGGDGPGMAALTSLATRGPAAGFVTVFPDGLDRVWNDGRRDRRLRSRLAVDDTAFLRALVDHLASTRGVDPGQVYVCGISNGAIFTDHLAREMPLAGIGLVAGTATVVGRTAGGTVAHATPVTILAGTADPLVPYGGGPIGAGLRRRAGTGRGQVMAAEALASDWASTDGCAAAPVWQQVPVAPDDLPVWHATWADAAGRTWVELFRIDGGGHTWPGGLPYLPERFIGRTARLDATGILLDRWSRLSVR
jgi:polyhydroxybutyrate depolymerase